MRHKPSAFARRLITHVIASATVGLFCAQGTYAQSGFSTGTVSRLCHALFIRTSPSLLPQSSEASLQNWLQTDLLAASSSQHASNVRLIRDSNGFTRTKTSVLLLHGLYNSPLWMSDLAGYFHANQMNVVNARLPGHFEKQFDALNTTHRGEWITATNSSFKIASELGEKVLLVGHSTGGLLASLMAIKNPEQVAGLVLLAPAYRLTVMSRLKAAFSSQVEIAYTEQETGRYISGPAGQQVVLLGREFWAELSKDPNLPPIDVLKAKLRHVPILMINTALDKTIDPAFNRVVMQVLSEGNRSDAKRRHLLLPETDQTLHSAITLRANTNGSEQSFTKIQESLHEFLFDHSLSKDAETRIEP